MRASISNLSGPGYSKGACGLGKATGGVQTWGYLPRFCPHLSHASGWTFLHTEE